MLLIAFAEPRATELDTVRLGGIELPKQNLDFYSLLSGKREEDKRRLYPHILHYLLHSGGKIDRDHFIEYLNREADPIALAYGIVAKSLFAEPPGDDISSQMRRLIRGTKDHPSILIAFYASLHDISRGLPVTEEALMPICSIPSEREACAAVQLGTMLNRMIRSAKISRGDLKSMMESLRPYLRGNERGGPFFSRIASKFPQKLMRMGFPLEAALLASRIQKSDPLQSGILQKELPHYLIAAGDLVNAQKMIDGDAALTESMKGELMDWILLAGDYRRAVELADRIGPETLLDGGKEESRDYWSGEILTPETLQMKMALILFLAGDPRKALKMLERLSSVQTKNGRGEPYRLYARLRMAQILLRDNPELSHKIAEDVSYIAQENGWEQLEYLATVLDGWANYFFGREFHATVDFVKSNGILSEPTPASSLSRSLGIVCLNAKGRESRKQDALISEIRNRYLKEPMRNEAYLMLRNWLPISSRDLYVKAASTYLERSGRGLDALNLYIALHNQREFIFLPGENPGGMRGLVSSLLWIGGLNEIYQYRKKKSAFRLESGVASVIEEIVSAYGAPLKESHLKQGTTYLLSFPEESGRKMFRIRKTDKIYYYGRGRKRRGVKRRIWDVDSIRIDGGKIPELVKRCALPAENCDSIAAELGDMAPARGERLRVLLDPAFDLDYGKIFPYAKEIEFFYSPLPLRKPSPAPVGEMILPSGCGGAAPPEGRRVEYAEQFITNQPVTGAMMIWPQEAIDKSGGRLKPVYLRGFACGEGLPLRMWEIDRYSEKTIPSIIVHGKIADPELARVFVRHFSEKGSALIQPVLPVELYASKFYEALQKRGRPLFESIRTSIRAISGSGSGWGRLILPDITD
jgi:hypothetical protein